MNFSMEARWSLKQALGLLKEMHDKGDGVEGAINGFARCHWVSLQENDGEGCFWSAKLIQGILALGPPQQDPNELFQKLLQMFEGERSSDSLESDLVAVAAFHAGSLQRCDAKDAETWLKACLDNAKPGSYLRYLACLELGKLLLMQDSRLEDAVKWFEAAKGAANLTHLATLASYYLGKSLAKLGRFEEASASLKNEDLMPEEDTFATALAKLLDADVKLLKGGASPDYEEVLKTYEDARILLQAGNFLPSLERKLVEYVGSSCCPCLLLMQYLRLDQFTRFAIMTDARQSPGVPIEACFYAWELYRDARCEMLKLQDVTDSDRTSRYCYMDPKPHLERGIEYMYSTRKTPELVPLGLDSLVISQQISSKMGNLSGLYWAGVFLDDYIDSGYGEDTSSRIFACFKQSSMDEEDPDAWANYYLGRAGARDGLVSEAQRELLKKSLKKTTGHLLGYHAAYALANASGMDFQVKSEMMERMRDCAVESGNQELIISSMLQLFQTLILGQKIERAQQVHSELVQLMKSSSLCSGSGPASELGKGVIEFLDGLRFNVCFDRISGSRSHKRAIEILEPLWQTQGRGSLGSYLRTRIECLSQQSKMCLEITYRNALAGLSYASQSGTVSEQTSAISPPRTVSRDVEAVSSSDHYLHMFYDQIQGMAEDIETKIMELVKQNENLQQADEAARSLLENLQSEEYTSSLPGHENAAFRWYLLISRAELAVKLSQRRAKPEEDVVTVIGELMKAAMDASQGCINSGSMRVISTVFHGFLLASLNRNALAIEKLETGLRQFMALDPDLGQLSSARISFVDGLRHNFQLLQKCLYDEGEVRRALIWSEREHTRDFVHKGNLRDKAAGFDSEDDRAWLEIQGISSGCGRDTVIIVMSHLMETPSSGSHFLLSFLLHAGEIVGHRLVAENLIRISDLLDLIFSSRDEVKQHEQLKGFHSAFIAPYERELREIQPRRIIFATSQDLALVPYSALMAEDDTFLIEKYIISIVPSLRLLEHCTRRLQELVTDESEKTALVVGNPNSPGFIPLPAAMGEAREVSATLQETGFVAVRQLYGSEPTKDVALSLFQDFSWIHLACHCEVSDLLPEGALILSGAENDDLESFSLTSQEIADKCRLRAIATVLSACSSGMGKKMNSSEGIMALPRSFHMAGVPSVVMSLWAVGDETTQELMRRFYSALVAGKDLGDALQGAIVETIRDIDFGNVEIRDWAAFIISGSPFTSLKFTKMNPKP